MSSIDPDMRIGQRLFRQEDVPVFVICFNRLDYLRRLVSWLERSGFQNIILVDNASDYPPLEEYLSASPHRVEIMEENLGHLVVWESHRFDDIVELTGIHSHRLRYRSGRLLSLGCRVPLSSGTVQVSSY